MASSEEVPAVSVAEAAIPIAENNKKGEITMSKKILVEGMSCGHCSARVEKALNAIDGVTAKVDLEAKTAFVDVTGNVSDDALKKAVEDAGYEVKGIS